MKLIYVGSSKDGRTNKWKIVCDCCEEIYPKTTVLSKQEIECPKCHLVIIANYNEKEVKAKK